MMMVKCGLVVWERRYEEDDLNALRERVKELETAGLPYGRRESHAMGIVGFRYDEGRILKICFLRK